MEALCFLLPKRTIFRALRSDQSLGGVFMIIGSFFSSKKVKAQPKPALTLNAFFDDYFYPHIEITKKLPRHDLLTYDKHLRKSLGRKPLLELETLTLDRWVHAQIKKDYEPGTINKHIFLLNRILNMACHWGFIDTNTFRNRRIKKLPMGDYKQRFLNEEEILKLLQACQTDVHPFLYVYVKLLILTGARKSEALKARWRDINIGAQIWNVPVSKNGRSRRIILSNAAIATLVEIEDTANRIGQHVTGDSFLFTNPKTGTHYHSFDAAWFRAKDDAGLYTTRLHDLRHTFASLLINNGASIFEVQKLLGHHHISMTERYAHLLPDTLKARVEIMPDKLDAFKKARRVSI